MKHLKHFKLAHQVAAELMTRLSRLPEEKYCILTGVMPQDITADHHPAGALPALPYFEQLDMPVIDLLICTEDGPVLAASFENMPDLEFPYFIHLDSSHSVNSLCNELQKESTSLLEYPSGDYDFPLLPVKLFDSLFESPEEGPFQFPYSVLKEASAIDEKGFPTPYGTYCGLVTRYAALSPKAPGATVIDQRVGAENAAARLFDSFCHFEAPPVDESISLEERLHLLYNGYPGDRAYGEKIMHEIQDFLRTPLKEYFQSSQSRIADLYQSVQHSLRRLSEWNGEFPAPETIGELLQTVWTFSNQSSRGVVRTECEELLFCIAARVCPCYGYRKDDPVPPDLYLNLFRKGQDRRYSAVFRHPLKHFFLEASRVRGSYYPFWLYCTYIQPKLTGCAELRYAPLSVAAGAVADHEKHGQQCFPILYRLLVLPFCKAPVEATLSPAQRAGECVFDKKLKGDINNVQHNL